MRGSSESVPTFNRSLLPSAEYIGCRRYCSAAARRTPAVIVGWKIARPVLLLPRIPLRYALPGWVSKAGYQAIRNRQGAAAKRGGQSIRDRPFRQSPATARMRQQKEDGRASRTANRQSPTTAKVRQQKRRAEHPGPPTDSLPQLPGCGSKREGQGIRDRLPPISRNCQGAAAKEEGRASGTAYRQSSATARVRQQKEEGRASGTANRQSPTTAKVRQRKRTARHPEPPFPPISRNRQDAAAKEELRASGNTPSFRNFHMWLNGQRPRVPTRPKPP